MDTKKGRAVYWIAGLSALMLAGSIGVMSDPAQAKMRFLQRNPPRQSFSPCRVMRTVFC